MWFEVKEVEDFSVSFDSSEVPVKERYLEIEVWENNPQGDYYVGGFVITQDHIKWLLEGNK